jgi:hypothetical protein
MGPPFLLLSCFPIHFYFKLGGVVRRERQRQCDYGARGLSYKRFIRAEEFAVVGVHWERGCGVAF